MMRTSSILISVVALWVRRTCTAFVQPSPSFVRSSNQLTLNGLVDASSFPETISAVNNLWISTIDSDIASIPNDQFGLVFAGGIMVMAGGVISAVIVGFLLEKGDLYASIAAESYLQSAEDEEFWKGLSDEEQSKAREMMDKIKATKNGSSLPEVTTNSGLETTATTTTQTQTASPSKPKGASKPMDIFSDYGE